LKYKSKYLLLKNQVGGNPLLLRIAYELEEIIANPIKGVFVNKAFVTSQ
jgi:hypothetical protein